MTGQPGIRSPDNDPAGQTAPPRRAPRGPPKRYHRFGALSRPTTGVSTALLSQVKGTNHVHNTPSDAPTRHGFGSDQRGQRGRAAGLGRHPQFVPQNLSGAARERVAVIVCGGNTDPGDLNLIPEA